MILMWFVIFGVSVMMWIGVIDRYLSILLSMVDMVVLGCVLSLLGLMYGFLRCMLSMWVLFGVWVCVVVLRFVMIFISLLCGVVIVVVSRFVVLNCVCVWMIVLIVLLFFIMLVLLLLCMCRLMKLGRMYGVLFFVGLMGVLLSVVMWLFLLLSEL